ncbi:hypothetical protein [Macrococcus capreoli]|uniref:hypothetical protein n=1 Tax=Macrococcus capreoli TaxID=2982690 RepID=UPI0021D6068F|nr:hypothetical protein [Macrococcus sp. TMW 2.2395]MCU7556545.1 hypothetical protein [Macrococcus sp. TMW 2.2395]
MSTNELNNDAYLAYVNDILTNPKRKITGISTKKYDIDDDITTIMITVAPCDDDE